MSNLMNYEEFKSHIMEHVLDYFPEEYKTSNVSIERMVKNNDTVLDGLRILQEGSNIAPVVYLNRSFEMYQNGFDLDEIVEKIANNYMENMHPDFGVNYETFTSYEAIKDNITCRLVNMESNAERLANAPTTQLSDLAVSYHVVVSQNNEGVASLLITNDLMERYGVSVDELHNQAITNMTDKNKPVFKPLADIMMETMLPDFAEEFGVGEEQAREMLGDMMPSNDGPDIYCLSNESKINGAATLVNPEVQEMIAEKVGGDYYILPSSIHECLIVPMGGNMTYQELEAMVQEVNATQVQPEERLSDHVYQYDGKNHKIERADQMQKMFNTEIGEKFKEVVQEHLKEQMQDTPEIDAPEQTKTKH